MKNCHRPEETKETHGLNAAWDAGLGPRTEKGYLGENWENLSEVLMLVNIGPVLMPYSE